MHGQRETIAATRDLPPGFGPPPSGTERSMFGNGSPDFFPGCMGREARSSTRGLRDPCPGCMGREIASFATWIFGTPFPCAHGQGAGCGPLAHFGVFNREGFARMHGIRRAVLLVGGATTEAAWKASLFAVCHSRKERSGPPPPTAPLRTTTQGTTDGDEQAAPLKWTPPSMLPG